MIKFNWSNLSDDAEKFHMRNKRLFMIFETANSKKIYEKMSRARMNFTEASEAALNEQVKAELTAYYKYQAIASWLNRDDIALPGLAEYFYNTAVGEQAHAKKVMDYIATRGGKVVYREIPSMPNEWESALNVMKTSLQIEQEVNASLLRVHKIAGEEDDPALQDFIESEFLGSQNEQIKRAADLVTQLERCGGEGLGLYLFDKSFQKANKESDSDDEEGEGYGSSY